MTNRFQILPQGAHSGDSLGGQLWTGDALGHFYLMSGEIKKIKGQVPHVWDEAAHNPQKRQGPDGKRALSVQGRIDVNFI